ncbi:MAG: putative protein-disulfide isomerase [Alcanivorax sp.]|jgi:putative protein-disulfide isomerase
MCSWCWGYRKTWNELRTKLPSTLTIINVVGGLAPDSDKPMPVEQQKTIAGYWANVTEQTGAEFNFDFWKNCEPRRSTYPACRAVLAAKHQGAEQLMIDAIQHAYYLRTMNPSDNSTLVRLATELNLDAQQFEVQLSSAEIQQELESEFALRRTIGVNSFPSLVLVQGELMTAIDIDYRSYEPTLATINTLLA